MMSDLPYDEDGYDDPLPTGCLLAVGLSVLIWVCILAFGWWLWTR